MSKKHFIGVIISLMMVITMIPSFSCAADLPFTDVAADSWYYNDVKGAYDTGLINGMTDTAFEPDSNMTYAQAVKLAACMNQKYTTGSVTLGNGSSNWWDSYVYYAKAFNIISKDYDWNSNATRAGYVEIFAKALPDTALKEKNRIADNYIPDVTMIHPQAAAIYKLYRAGILTGMDENGTFQPDSNIKRSEVSAILTRMMNENTRKDLTLEPVTAKYIVGFSSNGGSAVEAQQIAENQKAVKPADPNKEGYRFAGWYLDSSLVTPYDFNSPVTQNVYLYAKWEDNSTVTFTVNFYSNGGSEIQAQKVKENEKAVWPSDPVREGFIFAGWYLDSNLTKSYEFNSPVTEDMNLFAKWKETESSVFTITFETTGGSAIQPQKVKKNELAFWPSDPFREGYRFTGWYLDSNLTKEYGFTRPVTEDFTLYAKWVEKSMS